MRCKQAFSGAINGLKSRYEMAGSGYYLGGVKYRYRRNALQPRIKQLQTWLSNKIVGQKALVERLMIALLADGHLLVEGAPGVVSVRCCRKQ